MIEYFRADKNDVVKLKMLWLECFDDTQEAADLFFEENWHQMRAFCAKDNGRVISALYLIDSFINSKKSHYLCGASTQESYRGKNIMSDLIKFALESAKQDGDKFSVLVPANDSLYEYYARFGYRSECFVEKKAYTRDELLKFEKLSAREICSLEQLQSLSFYNDYVLWNNDYIKFACKYYSLYGAKVISTDDCFALFEENNGCAEVFYAISANKSVLAQSLIENSGAEKFIIIGKAKQGSDKERCGMIKSLDDSTKIPGDIYIGITLM